MTTRNSRLMQMLACTVLALTFASASFNVLAKKEQKTNYPDATRNTPKNDLTSTSDQKTLQRGLDALNAGDDAKAQPELQKVLDSSRSKYARGVALEGLANIKFNKQDYKGAIAIYKQLLELNSVPNDAYFDSMYNMAAAYVADAQYQAAQDQLKIWREQGKRETADSYALEGNIDYRLGKYPEAIAAIKKAQSMTDKPKDSWNNILVASYAESGKSDQAASTIDQQLAKDPNNKQLVHNAIVLYVQSNQSGKALALLARQQQQGMLSSEDDYVAAAKFYANIAQTDAKPQAALDGATLLQEGITKGIVKASAANYKLLGDSYLIGEKEGQALAAYDKASPLASNGDIDMRRAEILGQQQNWAGAKAAAQKAVSRGTTHPGKTYLLLGKLNLGLQDKAAAKAAFLKAQQDADTREAATSELHKLQGGKK